MQKVNMRIQREACDLVDDTLSMQTGLHVLRVPTLMSLQKHSPCGDTCREQAQGRGWV